MKKKPSANAASAKDGKVSREQLLAGIAIQPSAQASTTIQEFNKSLGELDLDSLNTTISSQIVSVQSNNLKAVESMLFAQATALESIFYSLSRRAIANIGNVEAFDGLLRLSFKAQSQSRATLETLGKIKNPQPIAFVRQANIANGHQQINNGSTTRAQENISAPNELLEVKNGQRMDTGTSSKTVGASPQLEAVEAVHRPEDNNR